MSDISNLLRGVSELPLQDKERALAEVIGYANKQQNDPVKLAFPGLSSIAFIDSFVAPSLCFHDDVTGIFIYVSPGLLPNLVPDAVAPRATSLAASLIVKIPVAGHVNKEDINLAFQRTVMQAMAPSFKTDKVAVMIDMESKETPTSFGDNWIQLFGLAIFQVPAAVVEGALEVMREILARE